ncbi:uncharacterized protein LOC135843397 [Planococcus citri]|uniref:uncharacterized protein LOC135843397 n=1 Tax=Planococcus citri TaxID=170843 RepID=UPI0031F7DA31
MNPLIFAFLCFFFTEVRSEIALLFNFRDGKFYSGDLEDIPLNDTINRRCAIENKYVAACPASSPLEHQFNRDVSLTKQSVFSRLILWRNEPPTESELDFCEKSYEPGMIYNSQRAEYEIGYEMYLFGNEIRFVGPRYNYHHCKMVNTKKPPYKVVDQTIFNDTSEFVIRYEDRPHIMFNFTNGYPTLGFYWINVLSIKSSKNNKHAKFRNYDDVNFVNVNEECKNYRPVDEKLYSQENQEKCLKDILVPSSSFKETSDLSCGQPYGCLTPSQIIPLWHFYLRTEKLASCSHLNLIPAWKSIADGNLRRVDLFVAAISKDYVSEVIFGVNGVLKMMAGLPGDWRKMYLSDTKGDRVVEIPKIIYRIIKFRALDTCNNHIAVIVIHNDPSGIRDTDRLCDKNDTLIHTWDKIINDDPKTGLTYVCPMTTDLEKKLDVNCCGINKLNLAEVPHEHSLHSGEWGLEDRQKFINSNFEKFLNESPK